MNRSLVIAAVVIATVLLVAGAFLLDHRLSRADRVGATARRDAMIEVRDQILRYQAEHGVLPRSLDEVVPLYVRLDQIAADNVPLYTYRPAERMLVQAAPNPVRGLTRRDWPALRMMLPESGESPAPSILAAGPADHALLVPTAPDAPEPPEGALVWEAEHWSAMNWGWEIHPDPQAGGGAYIHSWEGKTNRIAQLDHGIYDFYDVRPAGEPTRLRYRFHLDEPGEYYLFARMWTTDTHCSNSVAVWFDEESDYDRAPLGNTTPFTWLWSTTGGWQYLRAGDHELNVFIHEDGLRIDQFALTSSLSRFGKSGKPLRANLAVGAGTKRPEDPAASLHLSFDVKSEVLSPDAPVEARLTIRRTAPAAGRATVRAWLAEAGMGGRDWKIVERDLDLSALPEVEWLPLSFEDLDVAALDRREYMLRAEAVVDGRVVAAAHETLLRPFAWEVLGPLDLVRSGRPGPFDASAEPGPRDSRRWVALKETSLDHFGVLDFGMHTNGNSLHAPQRATIYARTRVRVPATANYVLLLQSDDQMVLWVDEREVYRYDHTDMPVTRSATRKTVRLDAGEHELRMRVNQIYARWQASVRIRNADDSLSRVVGAPAR